MKELVETLRKRGLVEGETSEQISSIVEHSKPVSIYCGFDPTADCLHLGHLVPIVALSWFRRFGHKAVALVGGATGLIGDPSGKSVERVLLSSDQLAANVRGVQSVLETILSRSGGEHPIQYVNNQDWFTQIGCIEFLRDIGRHFRIGTMIGRESVRARMASEEGLSYTEFSYQILQAYDFYHLFVQHGVTIQMGGSDQWGNITAGIDLVRRLTAKEVWGLTFPLLLKSDGKKFGKSESGAIWLSESHLPAYDFYQYLFRTSDADVIRMLKVLTFVDLETIDALEVSMKEPGYVPNTAQKLFADEVTRFVHGDEGLARARKVTAQAMPGQAVAFSREQIEALLGQVPTKEFLLKDIVGARVCNVLADSGLVPSRAEGRRLIRNGGVAVNGRKISNEFDSIFDEDLVDRQYIMFSLGKQNRAILKAIW